jgi:hypothetical protein
MEEVNNVSMCDDIETGFLIASSTLSGNTKGAG